MTFTRTPAGLANQSLFFRSKFIVYVEEEPNLDPARSVDITFWRMFFVQNFPNLTFEVRGLGGKSHVINMAHQVINNSIPNVLCAMDADYDFVYGDAIQDERVFYTHGYGAENDILNETTVKRLVKTLVPGSETVDDSANIAWSHVETCLNADRICFISDQVVAARGTPP